MKEIMLCSIMWSLKARASTSRRDHIIHITANKTLSLTGGEHYEEVSESNFNWIPLSHDFNTAISSLPDDSTLHKRSLRERIVSQGTMWRW